MIEKINPTATYREGSKIDKKIQEHVDLVREEKLRTLKHLAKELGYRVIKK